jgi:hypothetical protein
MIKSIISGGMIAISLMSFSTNTVAEAPIPIPQPTVQELVIKYSEEYDVSATKMMKIMKCENTNLDSDFQSELTYKKGNRWNLPAGSREQSYGLVQIHLPDHDDITYEQAIDPDFSVNYLAKNLHEGHGEMWSCYHKV